MFEKWKLIYTSAGIVEYAANFFSIANSEL
jgi:hypothetical protein